MSAAARQLVIATARTWLGTPFHDHARLKGVGTDCACFLAEVYAEAGIIPNVDIEPYGAQWMLHSDVPLFENYVRRYAREVETPEPGDVALYRVGRSFAHGAIVIEWPRTIIHAFKSFGFVAETTVDEADLKGRARKFFSMW